LFEPAKANRFILSERWFPLFFMRSEREEREFGNSKIRTIAIAVREPNGDTFDEY